MKELLIDLAKYNMWANALFINELSKLSDEQLDKELISSFPTIRKTVSHIWSAEDIWLQRLGLKEQPVWAESVFTGSFEEMCTNWEETSKGLLSFIERQYSDTAFEHVLQYYNLKKQSAKIPVYVVLVQVLNHGTYHRGQLVTMMRQVGVKKIPASDYVIYKAKNK